MPSRTAPNRRSARSMSPPVFPAASRANRTTSGASLSMKRPGARHSAEFMGIPVMGWLAEAVADRLRVPSSPACGWVPPRAGPGRSGQTCKCFPVSSRWAAPGFSYSFVIPGRGTPMNSSAPEQLETHFGGRWTRGDGVETELVDPVNGSVLATASARGLDLASALDFARRQGGPALRALSFADRAKLLGAIADVLLVNRARYEAIAIANSGNTRTDAAIDIDGGIGTLKYYARLGATLADAKVLVDDKPVRLAKAENFQALHVLSPRRGVAIHINAFNFPSWGLWEKAAVSLLAGVPALAKPASATALLSHAMVRDVVAANVLPAGALSLLCGSAGDLLDHVTADDVIAFTGSSETASRIRSHANLLPPGT